MRLTRRGLALTALSIAALLLTAIFANFVVFGPDKAAQIGAEAILKNLIIKTGLGSAALLLMTFLYWRGYRHAGGIAALLATLLVPVMFVPEAFEHTIPQAIWIPFILALAISTVWWALLTLAASVGLAVATFPAAYAETYTILGSGMIAVLLIAARLTQDRLLADALDAKRQADASAAAAREAELRFRRMFEANGCAMLLVEPSTGRILAANLAASVLYGYPSERLTGMSTVELDTTPAAEAEPAGRPEIGLEGGRFECRIGPASGRQRDVEVHSTPVEMDGRPVLFWIVHDVTDRKQAEAMLLQSRKMEAMGTLAGGIAHDFNNILTSVLGFNRLIRDQMANPQVVTYYVEQIGAAANRAKELVRQILAFSRQAPVERCPIDLCRTTEEIRQLVRAAAPATIDIALDLPPGRATIQATSIELHQVVMNLCANAIDAIGDAPGRIAIAVRPADGAFELSVTDTGCGIPAEIQSRLFDPFFTTKGPGKGTGLGLSVAHGIVEDLGGTIRVESPAEGGARFVIRLPALAAGPDEPAPAARVGLEPLAAQGRDVLVVDDEIRIAEVLELYLSGRGHRVSATTVPAEALGWIRGGRRFDVMVADHMMPEVNGLDLARAVAECAPGTRVLLCSGRDDMIGDEEMRAARIQGFLVKPFELEELAEMVERA